MVIPSAAATVPANGAAGAEGRRPIVGKRGSAVCERTIASSCTAGLLASSRSRASHEFDRCTLYASMRSHRTPARQKRRVYGMHKFTKTPVKTELAIWANGSGMADVGVTFIA